MSDPISTSSVNSSGGAPQAPSSADPTTAGNIASAHGSSSVTTSTKLNSLDELRQKAPKVYHQMMLGIAMNICGSMRRHAARLKQMIRESKRVK